MDQDPHIVGVFFYVIINSMDITQEQLKSLEESTVDFDAIKNLFDKTWDVGYLSSDRLLQCAHSPIKEKFHIYGVDYSNNIHFGNVYNSIVLIKKGHTWDYSHYQEAIDILSAAWTDPPIGWYPSYTNYKQAALHAGLGVRAKNSLIYSYKFGFDCHICMISFIPEIINYPNVDKKRNFKLWKHCEGCDDCIKHCPAKAIHYDEDNPAWIDSSSCENFIFYGKHDRIPSVLDYYHKNVHPEIPKETIDSISNIYEHRELIGDWEWDKNGYSYDGNVTCKDGEKVLVPHCRECASQPRCSKWKGRYPYEDLG